MMGMFKLFSSSEGPNPMPNPRRFEILHGLNIVHGTTTWAILEVLYPDCTNYEGKKILVYKGITTYRLRDLESLDPHFTKNGITPFARFEPTEEGWEGALSLARA
jgi:hypothetical protein